MIDVDTDRALATFLELVQIDSPTYAERPIIERIARELEALGLPTFNDNTGRDGAGNLHVRLPGTRADRPGPDPRPTRGWWHAAHHSFGCSVSSLLCRASCFLSQAAMRMIGLMQLSSLLAIM